MQTSSFNLVQTTRTLQKKWKTIFLFVIVCAVVATITVFLVPPYFKSTAIVVSANPVLADKARIFNNNIQNLYSYFGSGDDLDRINGIGDMDTSYKKLVDEFALVDYYGLQNDSLPKLKRKAVKLLRNDLSFQKTEQNQLKIIAWTKDKQLSANLVNRMVEIIEETATAVWQKNYKQSIEKLDASLYSMEQEYRALHDSSGKDALALMKMQTLSEQINQYRKTADEFKLASQTTPAVLYVMETGSPAAKAERPDKPAVILAACLIGFLFSCLLVLVNNRNSIA
jgi:LPS O-antigen subunit length determinant protein (WzzB/FepE family)